MTDDARPRRLSTGWLLAAGGAALLAGLWLGRALPPADTKQGEARDATPSVDVPGTASLAPTGSAALAALPPRPAMDAPLPETWPVLEARALAGDAVAACRLADGLARCRWLERAEASLRAPYQPSDDNMGLREAVDAARPHCIGLPPGLGLARTTAMRLAAARAGHARSALAFLRLDDLGGYDAFRAEAEPALRLALQARGPLFLERLEAGSLEAAALLYLEDLGGIHPPAVTLDDAERQALRALLGEHGVLRPSAMPDGPTPRVQRWAAAMAPDDAERARAIAVIAQDEIPHFPDIDAMAAQLARGPFPDCEVLP